MGNKGDMGHKGDKIIREIKYKNNMDNQYTKTKAGYEYLLAYKLSVAVEDLNDEFVGKYINKFSRTTDQMIQAGRSGSRNIVEGNKQQGLKGYIKLTGVARGSLDELLKDYERIVRAEGIEIWGKERVRGEIGEIGEIWEIIGGSKVLPYHPDFPHLPSDKTKAVNLMITLIHQTNYFLDKLIVALKDKHMREGGLTEELYRKRIQYRQSHQYA